MIRFLFNSDPIKRMFEGEKKLQNKAKKKKKIIETGIMIKVQ